MELLLSQLKSGSFMFVDGKADSATSSKIASLLATSEKGTPTVGESTAAPFVSHTVHLTVTAKLDTPEALALWPINQEDDWKGFFDAHWGAHEIQFHSIIDLEQSTQGLSLTLEVTASADSAGLAEQLVQAFPLVAVTAEALEDKKLINSFNPFSLSSSADMSKHLASLL